MSRPAAGPDPQSIDAVSIPDDDPQAASAGGSRSDPDAAAAPVVDPPTGPDGGRLVMNAAEVTRALRRIAHEILERNKGGAGLALMGIPSRGVPLAQRLGAVIADVEGVVVPVGELDITLFRDDLRHRPARPLGRTRLPAVGIDDVVVVLVDDVLYSGRTVRAALEALAELGRPRAVRLAVLVDRGHRELPVRADHVGKNLPTAASERVHVRVHEVDGVDEVRISGGRS